MTLDGYLEVPQDPGCALPEGAYAVQCLGDTEHQILRLAPGAPVRPWLKGLAGVVLLDADHPIVSCPRCACELDWSA